MDANLESSGWFSGRLFPEEDKHIGEDDKKELTSKGGKIKKGIVFYEGAGRIAGIFTDILKVPVFADTGNAHIYYLNRNSAAKFYFQDIQGQGLGTREAIDNFITQAVQKAVEGPAQPASPMVVDKPPTVVDKPAMTPEPVAVREAALTVTPTGLKVIRPDSIDRAQLSGVDSSKTTEIKIEIGGERKDVTGLDAREVFQEAAKAGAWQRKVPIFSKSDFVNEAFTEHLETERKPSACGVKYKGGKDAITNMEGALATFVTPIVRVTTTVDNVSHYAFAPLDKNTGRECILSMAVQPDYELEKDEVMMKITALQEKEVVGEPLPEDFKPLATVLKKYPQERERYEQKLQKHMIYHLISSHTLPAKSEAEAMALSLEDALEKLEQLVTKKDFSPRDLRDQFVQIGDHIHSLEILLNVYVHQMRNEFSVLEASVTQGYIYTIDPPSIFANQLGKTSGAAILNTMQILALKHLEANNFTHLKGVYFNDYADKKAIDLLKQLFSGSDIAVGSKASLFEGKGTYVLQEMEGFVEWVDGPGNLRYIGPTGYALIDHNNSDGFGWNIGTEGGKDSKDAINGQGSDASVSVDQKNLKTVSLAIV